MLLEDLLPAPKLGNFAEIKTQFPDADFWIVRRGSAQNVGAPTKSYNPENIGIKVTAVDKIDPRYLFYVMQYLHSQGYWQNLSHGSLNLVNIRRDDVKNIPLNFN